jgi:prevent-host-death family protein
MRSIPRRELRNQIARVLREVEAGETLRITVDGQPVADLVPIRASRRTFVPREDVFSLLERAPLGPEFAHDVDEATGATIDEL